VYRDVKERLGSCLNEHRYLGPVLVAHQYLTHGIEGVLPLVAETEPHRSLRYEGCRRRALNESDQSTAHDLWTRALADRVHKYQAGVDVDIGDIKYTAMKFLVSAIGIDLRAEISCNLLKAIEGLAGEIDAQVTEQKAAYKYAMSRGHYYRRRNNYEQAVEQFDRGVEAGMGVPSLDECEAIGSSYLMRGYVKNSDADFEGAADCYRAAIREFNNRCDDPETEYQKLYHLLKGCRLEAICRRRIQGRLGVSDTISLEDQTLTAGDLRLLHSALNFYKRAEATKPAQFLEQDIQDAEFALSREGVMRWHRAQAEGPRVLGEHTGTLHC